MKTDDIANSVKKADCRYLQIYATIGISTIPKAYLNKELIRNVYRSLRIETSKFYSTSIINTMIRKPFVAILFLWFVKSIIVEAI